MNIVYLCSTSFSYFLYERVTRSLTLQGEHTLRIFVNRV